MSGCARTNCNKRLPILILPEMPLGGQNVANELIVVCTEKSCPNLIEWLNEMYIFRIQYSIYKEGLSK